MADQPITDYLKTFRIDSRLALEELFGVASDALIAD
jgi:hypothetical protein